MYWLTSAGACHMVPYVLPACLPHGHQPLLLGPQVIDGEICYQWSEYPEVKRVGRGGGGGKIL